MNVINSINVKAYLYFLKNFLNLNCSVFTECRRALAACPNDCLIPKDDINFNERPDIPIEACVRRICKVDDLFFFGNQTFRLLCFFFFKLIVSTLTKVFSQLDWLSNSLKVGQFVLFFLCLVIGFGNFRAFNIC